MTKYEFTDLINQKQIFDKNIDIIEDIFKCSILEAKIFEIPNIWFDKIVDANFTNEGADLIYNFLYEEEYSDMTIEELYNELVAIHGFDN